MSIEKTFSLSFNRIIFDDHKVSPKTRAEIFDYFGKCLPVIDRLRIKHKLHPLPYLFILDKLLRLSVKRGNPELRRYIGTFEFVQTKKYDKLWKLVEKELQW